jgi:hypothetical protein
MPEPTAINMDAFMQLTDKQTGRFPWETRLGHDHSAAEDAVLALYEGLLLPRPRIAWASSPAAMWRAVQILKGYAHKFEFIDALVPKNAGIEAEAKRTVLSAILDTDLLTSTGAALKGMIGWRNRTYPHHYRAIDDIAGIIGAQEEAGIHREAAQGNKFVSRQPRYHMNVIYPALCEAPLDIVRNVFSMLPYMRVCWLSMPPEFVKVDAEGHLHCDTGPAARWSDGFEIHRNREEELRLEAERTKRLEADTAAPARPEGVSAMDMLREAAAEKRLTDGAE